MTMRRGTPLGRVRGLGAAGEGAHHWWMQRLTAITNLLLFAWFLTSIFSLPNLDHHTVLEWMRQPLVAVPLSLLSISIFWHLRLGVQVMLEDYVAGGARIFWMLLLTAFAIIGAALCVFSILNIAFGA